MYQQIPANLLHLRGISVLSFEVNSAHLGATGRSRQHRSNVKVEARSRRGTQVSIMEEERRDGTMEGGDHY